MPVVREPNENPVAHAMTTHSRMATNEWRHKIRLQEYFEDETTHELIDSLCKRAIRGIDAVIEDEKLRSDQKDVNERDYFLKYLQECRDGFDGLIGAGEGESVEDREEYFNGVLNDLFDIGDWKIELRDGRLQKFLWVG